MSESQSDKFRDFIRGQPDDSTKSEAIYIEYEGEKDDELNQVSLDLKDFQATFDIGKTVPPEKNDDSTVEANVRAGLIRETAQGANHVPEVSHLIKRQNKALNIQSEFENHRNQVLADIDNLKSRIQGVEETVGPEGLLHNRVEELENRTQENAEDINRINKTIWRDFLFPISLGGSILLSLVTIWFAISGSIGAIPTGLLSLLMWTAVWQVIQE